MINFHVRFGITSISIWNMEANFSLETSKTQIAFWERISDDRLMNLFIYEDTAFLSAVKLILGLEYVDSGWKYRMNADIVSLFMAWCLELWLVLKVREIMKKHVKKEWLGGMEALLGLAWDMDDFEIVARAWIHVSEFTPPLWPFFLWSATFNKEARRSVAQAGMYDIVQYLVMANVWEARVEIARWGPWSEYRALVQRTVPACTKW